MSKKFMLQSHKTKVKKKEGIDDNLCVYECPLE